MFSVIFEWDDVKNALNFTKHGITFEEASLIFEGRTLSWVDRRFDYGERRTISVGVIRGVVAVSVVHTERLEKVRIISARLANRHERKRYDEYLGKAP